LGCAHEHALCSMTKLTLRQLEIVLYGIMNKGII